MSGVVVRRTTGTCLSVPRMKWGYLYPRKVVVSRSAEYRRIRRSQCEALVVGGDAVGGVCDVFLAAGKCGG